MSEEVQQLEIPVERIVVIPDLYDAKESLILTPNGFSSFFKTYGFGWQYPQALIRTVERPDAEPFPNPFGERVRQMIANIMVFLIPDQLYFDIGADNGETNDYELINRIIEEARLFTSIKLKASGESRLHGKLAAGFGGHVDEVDVKHLSPTGEAGPEFIDQLISQAAYREIMEELSVADEERFQTFEWLAARAIVPLGVINSSASEVERVHIGMINVMAVPESCLLSIGESDKLQAVAMPIKQLKDREWMTDHFILDNWTEILFSNKASLFAAHILKSITEGV